MIGQPRYWRLERNGNAVFAAVGDEFTCYAEVSGPPGPGARSPTWQLTLSWDGLVVVTDEQGRETAGPGVLVSPGLWHTMRHPAGVTSVWIDPHRLTLPRGIHALDQAHVRRLLADLEDEFDPDRLRRTVHRALGDPPVVDPRLTRALAMLGGGADLAELADGVGLSARRLRQLSASMVGCSLTKLRRWHRVREAGLLLPFLPTAEVAVRTGFADQAHLIRSMAELTGRTPGSALAVAGIRPLSDGLSAATAPR
ncbi:AraC family transcriptional regulator [Nocardia uniformis]|uniref:AraC family transcriptional regulator n=1 Tax=Nocardia uniformis TaxID=53432 RepID=A0A849BZG5_9NOCA|nr:helix-turn-helix domain-containing protein [Nocardia uniformis]NNH71943.1 AraC family transcriptional regulator [Nocardia uniformis]